MTYQSPEDFLKEEWIGVDEDRGIVRRQRVYRQLLMTPGLYRDGENEEDFAYLRNQRNLIASDMEEFFDCELQVHKNSAFLVLGEECHMGRTFRRRIHFRTLRSCSPESFENKSKRRGLSFLSASRSSFRGSSF